MASLLESRLWRLLCHRHCIKQYFTSTSCQAKDEITVKKKLMKNSPRRDPLPLFLEPKVQSMLTDMSGFDVDKVTAPRLLEDIVKPSYELMTDDDLKEAKEKQRQYCEDMMQMPPYMNPRKEINSVLSRDPEISSCLDTKYVFTDISHGIKDRERIIVVRDEDGTLRQAHWNERDRMNQIYNPQPGRNIVIPLFFSDGSISHLLFHNEHRHILDRACVQFEPDDEKFILVYRKVYDHIYYNMKFDLLWSTRYFGHMVFDRAWTNKTARLLLYYLETRDDGIVEASKVIQLVNYLFGKTDVLDSDPAKTETAALKTIIYDYIQEMPNTKIKKRLLQELFQSSERREESA